MTDDLAVRVEQACQQLLTAGAEVTFGEVATRVGIGRATLYRRPELRAIVEEHRQRGRDALTLTGLQVQIDQLRAALEAVAAKARRHVVDFDDLLAACASAIEGDPGFAAAQRWRFRHLFVDEFQDVNPLQFRLLEAWRGDRWDVFVVGDSIWDLLAARRAQTLGIGLLCGGYGTEELERAGAYRVYDDPAMLLDHLDEVGVRGD